MRTINSLPWHGLHSCVLQDPSLLQDTPHHLYNSSNTDSTLMPAHSNKLSKAPHTTHNTTPQAASSSSNRAVP
jgi:hypothetical protein